MVALFRFERLIEGSIILDGIDIETVSGIRGCHVVID